MLKKIELPDPAMAKLIFFIRRGNPGGIKKAWIASQTALAMTERVVAIIKN